MKTIHSELRFDVVLVLYTFTARCFKSNHPFSATPSLLLECPALPLTHKNIEDTVQQVVVFCLQERTIHTTENLATPELGLTAE